jgi:uncharacterized protein (TIGR01777 family)
MRIAITGASGLIGSALVPTLRADGDEVLRLVRRQPTGNDEISWDPARRLLDPQALAGVDAVVHLAGVGVGDARWTTAYKARVISSRVDGTLTIARAVAAAPDPPRVLLSASAVGYYGDTGDRFVDESAGAGTGFLAETCVAWERATAPATAAGVRVVKLRAGIVLAKHGGALGKVLPLFRAGLGGRLGSGRQYMSWISLADEIAAIRFLLTAEEISGPVNLTAPTPVTNAEYTATLARTLHRPAPFVVPGVALRLALGDFAGEGVLAGQRVRPATLQSAGFSFAHDTIEAALDALL